MRKLAFVALLLMAVLPARAAPARTDISPAGGSPRAVLAFVPQKMFREDDLEDLMRRLGHAGYDVIVAAPDTTIAVGMARTVIHPGLRLDAADPRDFAALVLINGSGAVLCWDDSLLHERIRAFAAAGRLVAALGVTPVTLARTGLLKGRRATVFPHRAAVTDLVRAGARYVARPVVEDGNIMTASDSRYVNLFGRALIAWLRRH